MGRLGVASLLCLLVAAGCSLRAAPTTPPAATMAPPTTPLATATTRPPTAPASAAPTPTRTTPPTATPTATPSATPTPWWSQVMTGFEALLPAGAEPHYAAIQEWGAARGQTHEAVIIVPYTLPGRGVSLAAIARTPCGPENPDCRLSVYWDWQQEALGPRYWQEVRSLPQPTRFTLPTFLGRDEQGRWWLAVVSGQPPSLRALLPVSAPGTVWLETGGPERGQWLYWLVDGGGLTAYGWRDGEPVARWTLPEAPGRVVRPVWCDLTGDGQPELTLNWERATESPLVQIYRVEAEGFTLIGEVELPFGQHVDADQDGVAEFLWPDPPEAPRAWKVYGWNGERFAWREPLARAQAPTPGPVERENLPPLPAALYFRDQRSWLWQREGGPLQGTGQAPPPAPAPCRDVAPPPTSTPRPQGFCTVERLAAWSPDCRFAGIDIACYEGVTAGVVSADGSLRWVIPYTFVYERGCSTFAWDPSSRFLIHARAEGQEGLYRLDLQTGQVDTLLSLAHAGCWLGPAGWQYGLIMSPFGAVDPAVLPDGSILFTIQRADASAYPPPGVYRLFPGGELRLLADVPPAEVIGPSSEQGRYGSLLVSPDGSAFVYRVPAGEHEGPPYGALLLGTTDGAALWDLLPLASQASEFWWP